MSLTPLADLVSAKQDATFQNEDFKILIEQNLEYLKTATTNDTGFLQSLEIPDAEASACEGDFRKVCAYLGIPINMSWIVMRVNGLDHYGEYKKELTHITVPDYDIVYRLALNKAVTQTNI